jgi:Na+/H+ antiporter NhaD/arsenite permease-like protein
MIVGSTEVASTVFFGLAIIHTFSVRSLQRIGNKYPSGSVAENFFHLLGEIEVVFGIWAAFFLVFLGLTQGSGHAIEYLESRNFTESVFVFVIMTLCSTKPVLTFANHLINSFSKSLPFGRSVSFYATALIAGPLLGSLITEPAAMTVTALILLDRFYKKGVSERLRYATLGLLFVNVSIGGTLTPFAAPPVLMVARPWGWDLSHMLTHFGWKALIAILISTGWVTFQFRRELSKLPWHESGTRSENKTPTWLTLLHLGFLFATILSAHHLVVFAGLFLFFLGLVSVTREHQGRLALREGLLVAFFLGGLVILGGMQRWWLEPLLSQLSAFSLFAGSTLLTAITDNAALTYLGTQVPDLSEASRYALVAGAVTGGGLTVIANAPNPAGYGILNSSFGPEGISPGRLFLGALVPTLVTGACFWIL